MMNKPTVAVVIVHWNRRQLLEQFLPSVLASTYSNLKIFVADNASTDDSVAYIKSYFPQVSVIQLNKNYGYAGGYNEALKEVKADYYVLLNNDIEVPAGWIEPVIDLMEQQPNVGACQPKMIDYRNRNLFEYAGACGGFIDTLGYVFCRGRIFESLETDHNQYNEAKQIFWATGACLFVRAELFHKAGGFDEHFFAHMEEVDLCWRIQLNGYKLMAVPSSQVYHVGGGTLNKMSPQKTYLNFRNNLIMLTKNLPVSVLWWLVPFRSFLDLLSSLFFLLNGFPKYSWAVHCAHADYFFQLGKWWKLRQALQIKRKPLSQLTGVYKGSIVKQHFVKKIRFFSELVWK